MDNYNTQEEVWKDIKGYIGEYKVSNKGRVLSVKRRVPKSDGTTQLVREKILKLRVNSSGYYQASFGLGERGKRKNEFVHRLVAIAFLDNEEKLPVVNHIDGDIKNNNVGNLEWTTYSGNTTHAYETGLMKTGKVEVTSPNGELKLFKKYNDCSEFFGYKWHWVQYHAKKNGNPFEHKGYSIKVLRSS